MIIFVRVIIIYGSILNDDAQNDLMEIHLNKVIT